MAANKPAPIACTLSSAEFKTRAAWIAQLTDTTLGTSAKCVKPPS